MATIIVDCDISGESSLTATGVDSVSATHTDKLDAVGIHDWVDGAYGGAATASEIQLVRHRDRASPKLAEKCASGASLGSVKIHVFRNDDNTQEVLRLELGSVFVSRIEYGTADSKGVAFRRHNGMERMAAATNAGAYRAVGQTVNDARSFSRARAMPTPQFAECPGVPTDSEVERVWLSFSNVKWLAAGNVTGSYNNATKATFA